MSPDDVTVREGVIHIKCKKTDNGQYAFCATGPVCNKGDTYEYTERRDATMTPEEFTFKYEHDKAFRDSVSSYSFR